MVWLIFLTPLPKAYRIKIMIKVIYTCTFEWDDEDDYTDEDLIASAIEIMGQSEFDSIGEFKIVREDS
jgi:hypothetical protein